MISKAADLQQRFHRPSLSNLVEFLIIEAHDRLMASGESSSHEQREEAKRKPQSEPLEVA